MELLAIVEAEEKADALIRDAQARKEQAIKAALQSREKQLAELQQPILPAPKTKPAAAIRFTANKEKAVERILEEIYAS